MQFFDRISKVLYFFAVLVICSFYVSIGQVAYGQANVEEKYDNFSRIVLEQGAALWKHKTESTYVQVIDLSKGAIIKFFVEDIDTTQETGEGAFGVDNPKVKRKDICNIWYDNMSYPSPPNSPSSAFSLCNGAFFQKSYPQQWTTPISYPLRINNSWISGGAKLHNNKVDDEPVNDLKMLELWNSRAKIRLVNSFVENLQKPILHRINADPEKDEEELSQAPNVLVGMYASLNSNDTDTDKRTFIGLADRNEDGLNETILILVSESLTKKKAVETLLLFGVDKNVEGDDLQVVMLDGGGSSQLMCVNSYEEIKNYVGTCGTTSRNLPQSIGVFSSPFSLSLTDFISTTENSTDPWLVGPGEIFGATFKVYNSGYSDVYIEKLALAIHKSSDYSFVRDIRLENYYSNLKPNEEYIFDEAKIDVNLLSAGKYKVVVKAYVNDKWFDLKNKDLTVKACVDPNTINLQINQQKTEEHVCKGDTQHYKFELIPNGNAYTITITPSSGNPRLYYSAENQDKVKNLQSWIDCEHLEYCGSSLGGGEGEKEIVTFISPRLPIVAPGPYSDTIHREYAYPVYIAVHGETRTKYSIKVSSDAFIPGDLDGDGDVDRDDINIIIGHRNQPASVCHKCDLDGDGTITVLDARRVTLLCTRDRCSTSAPIVPIDHRDSFVTITNYLPSTVDLEIGSDGNSINKVNAFYSYKNSSDVEVYVKFSADGMSTTGHSSLSIPPGANSSGVFTFWRNTPGTISNMVLEMIPVTGVFSSLVEHKIPTTVTYKIPAVSISDYSYIKFSDSSSIYYVFKHKLWPIKDDTTFYAMGASDFSIVKEYDSSRYEEIKGLYPINKAIVVDEGLIVTVPTSSTPDKIYKFSSGEWRWFKNRDVFDSLGHTDAEILEITPELFAMHSKFKFETFTVTNTGETPVKVFSVYVDGADKADFQIFDDYCSGKTIDISKDCQLSIIFQPITTGAKSATLLVNYSDTGTPPQNYTSTLSLSGRRLADE